MSDCQFSVTLKAEVMKMKENHYKSYDELPLMLSVQEIAIVLGISKTSAYELVRRKDFPVLKIGSRLVVPKEKFREWVEPSMVEEITEMLDTANATSKGDFVCQAVNFYIGYLHQQKYINYLSPILAQTIKSEIESVEKNISEMLFKLAVEQAKLSNVISATNQIDKVSLSALNNLCAEEVARNNGIITFENAYKFQRS